MVVSSFVNVHMTESSFVTAGVVVLETDVVTVYLGILECGFVIARVLNWSLNH